MRPSFLRLQLEYGPAPSVADASCALCWGWPPGPREAAVPRLCPWALVPPPPSENPRGLGNMPWFGHADRRAAGASVGLLTVLGDATVRKRPAPLSAPLRRKEEFSLFKVSDDEYKVKISPQLLLATQQFLSQGEGEGWPFALLSCSRPVGQEAPRGDTEGPHSQ